jgi:hypothetical protein
MTYRLYIPKELLGLLIAAIDFDDVAQALERVEGQANVKCEIPLTLTKSFPLTLRYIRKDKGFLLENRGGATCEFGLPRCLNLAWRYVRPASPSGLPQGLREPPTDTPRLPAPGPRQVIATAPKRYRTGISTLRLCISV